MNIGRAMARGEIMVHQDLVAERLDEIADLAEVWKRRRQSRQATGAVRVALINACGALAMLQEMERKA